jgi:CheY-like chemotaxis protein
MRHRDITVNILMAEDDDLDFELAEEVFARSRLSCRLYRFADGLDLLDFLLARGRHADRVIDKRVPCIILLDMNMPVMEGRATLKELKTNPSLRMLPVIMLTSTPAQEDVINAYDLGANSFVRKPLTFGEFVEVVNALKLFWFDVAELPVPLGLPGRGADQAYAPSGQTRSSSSSSNPK